MKFIFKLKEHFQEAMRDESGMGTLEVVIIIAVLLCLAFLLKDFVIGFFNNLKGQIERDNDVKNIMGYVWQIMC